MLIKNVWRTATKVRKPIPQTWRWILGISSIVFLLAGYTRLADKQHEINPLDTTIPTWSQLADGVHIIFAKHERTGERMIVEDLRATGFRMLVGLSCAIAIAIVLGIHMGCFSIVESIFMPPLIALAQCIPTAMLPIFFYLLGTETSMYVGILMFGITPSLTIAISLAVHDFTEEEIDTALTLGASKFEVVWVLIFRSILPRICELIRAHVGPALVYLIAGELLAADDGFGPRIRLESRGPNMHIVYPYVVILALLGLALRKCIVMAKMIRDGIKIVFRMLITRRGVLWKPYYRLLSYLICLGPKKSSTI